MKTEQKEHDGTPVPGTAAGKPSFGELGLAGNPDADRDGCPLLPDHCGTDRMVHVLPHWTRTGKCLKWVCCC